MGIKQKARIAKKFLKNKLQECTPLDVSILIKIKIDISKSIDILKSKLYIRIYK